jgi:hypothetical protein
MSITPAFQGEVQFATYSDSSRSGPRITLRLHDRAELERFVGKEAKRFMCVLVEIGDDEQPVQPAPQAEPKPPAQRTGPKALLAVQLCKNPAFQRWLIGHEDEENAARALRKLCDIESRRELDMDPVASQRFEQHIRRPWLAGHGVTA